MPSLFNIPEPTNGYRPIEAPAAPQKPLEIIAGPPGVGLSERPAPEDADEPQQQIDVTTWLMVLLIAGSLLRIVLGIFGPLQGVDDAAYQQRVQQGMHAFTQTPAPAFPLLDLLTAALSMAGLPGWAAIALGSVLTLGAVPAAYIIGRVTTGRRAAGLLAAALIAVHPAVLTASNLLAPAAFGLGLLSIGLALVMVTPRRGASFAVGGGLLLGLSTLAAPLCWVPAAIAGPFVWHLCLEKGKWRSVGLGLTVFLLAIGPMVIYRAVMLAPTPAGILTEFDTQHTFARESNPIDRVVWTLTDPSLTELGQAMHLPLGDAGRLVPHALRSTGGTAQHDPVADALADGWLLMNAGLASLAAVSCGVLLLRRRYLEMLLLASPILAIAIATPPPGEMLRLPMIALCGVLAAGLLANRPVVVTDEEALAAKRAAMLARKEEKQRARQERDLSKHKGDIFAFDKPTKRSKPKKALQAEEPAAPAGILTERVTDDPSIPMRPI